MQELDLTHAHWRKSSYSSANGQCVEVAKVPAQLRKSSHSSANGACVVIAHLPEVIAVRDSKIPDGPMLMVSAHEWRSFTKQLKSGEFDRR